MNDVTEQLRKIEEYFNSSSTSTSDPLAIQCDHNSLLDMAICLTDTEIYSEDGAVSKKPILEPTIFFPNDGEGYHVHFTQISDLLLMCRRIFEETSVFNVSDDGKVILSIVDLTNVNDRSYYAYNENYISVSKANLVSWRGSPIGLCPISQ